jgi:hypothetical protein
MSDGAPVACVVLDLLAASAVVRLNQYYCIHAHGVQKAGQGRGDRRHEWWGPEKAEGPY